MAVSLMLMSLVVLADNPHFIKTEATIDQNGSLTVSFKEAGLGPNQIVSYAVQGDVSAEFVCLNKGTNCPNAANKSTVTDSFISEFVGESGKNGQVSFRGLVVYEPDSGSFSCPNGQRLTLNKVTYTNLVLQDTTNIVTEALASTPSFDKGYCSQ